MDKCAPAITHVGTHSLHFTSLTHSLTHPLSHPLAHSLTSRSAVTASPRHRLRFSLPPLPTLLPPSLPPPLPPSPLLESTIFRAAKDVGESISWL